MARQTFTDDERVRMAERGRIQGLKNIETGHVQTMGRAQGRRNVETGHLERIKTLEVLEAGGRAAGRIAVESGQIHQIRTPESCSLGGKSGNHSRWHTARGIRNPNLCELCLEEMLRESNR